MLLNELFELRDPKKSAIDAALAALHRRAVSKGSLQDIGGYAFDIARSFNIGLSGRELARLYKERYSVDEALNNPYPVRWSSKDDKLWYGHAKEENVYDQIGISIKRITNGTWDINFSVNDTKQKSGGGDQFKIFATVKAAVQEWWNWASKNTDVNKIKFSAERIADTGRAKLYQRFAKQFADAIGYTLSVDSDRNYDTFNIEKPNVEEYNEAWSEKYKRSIDCSNPRGFSQRAHCAGRKKK